MAQVVTNGDIIFTLIGREKERQVSKIKQLHKKERKREKKGEGREWWRRHRETHIHTHTTNKQTNFWIQMPYQLNYCGII